MSASRLPVADDDAFCAKRNNSRSPAKRRQAAAGLSGAGIYTARAMNQRSFSKIFRGRGLIALGLVLILTFNFAIRWRLREMPLERDEGEYAYAGQLLLQGIPPYQLAYNMKFPGAYFGYAMLMEIFGESARGIHLGIALVTSLTAVFVFLIGCRLLNRAGALIATASFVLLSLSPAMLGFAGHATHFVALVNLESSWVQMTFRDETISDWWKGYSQNYELVGAADVFDDKPSQYFWDEQLLNRTNAHTGGILVYRRKPPFALSLKTRA